MTSSDRPFGQRQDVTGQQGVGTEPAGTYRDTPTTQTQSDEQSDMKDRVRDKADQARETVDQGRERASQGMESAADAMREHADQLPGGQRTTDIANQAADRVEGIAGYIQDKDMSELMGDVEQLVRDHPKESLIAAAAIGFFVARAIRS